MGKPPLYVKLWKSQRGLCWICGEPMIEWPRDHDLAWSFDHVKPLGDGGVNKPRNKLLAHRDCNTKRGCEPIPNGIKVKAYISRQLSRLDVIDKRKERFRSDAENNSLMVKESQ